MFRPGFLLAVALLGCGSIHAATLEQLSLDQMVQQATAIVRARAGESQAVRKGPLIYTQVKVEVLEQWKGEPLSTPEISLPGGEIGGYREHFGGVPLLSPGLEFVAFLWTGPSGRTQILGLSQGFFEIIRKGEGEVRVHRKATADVMLAPDTLTPTPYTDIEMPLEELVGTIRSTMAAGGPAQK